MAQNESIVVSEHKRQCMAAPSVVLPIPLIDMAIVSTGSSSSTSASRNINNEVVFNGSAMDSQDAAWYGIDLPETVNPKRRRTEPVSSPVADSSLLLTAQPKPPSRHLTRMDSEQAFEQFLNNS
jgi:hypothetical protein